MTDKAIDRSAVLVWETTSAKHEDRLTVISWTEYARSEKDDSFISLASEVENRSEPIRAQILAFVHETGNKTHRGKTIIETLKIRDSFSWWWMTLFALRRWHDDSNLYDLARIYALRNVLVERNISRLTAHGMPKDIEEAITSLCFSLTISFVAENTSSTSQKIKLVGGHLPLAIQAAAVIAWTAVRSGRRTHPTMQTKDGISFFDYLNGLNIKKLQNGTNASRYWGAIPRIFVSANRTNSWFHVFTPSADSPTPRRARMQIRKANSKTEDVHHLVSSSVGITVLVRSLIVFAQLAWASHKISNKHDLFVDSENGIDLTSLFSRDWIDSLRGRSAMHSAITFCAMEELLRKYPQQTAVIYLMENQPWEIALIHAWRKFQRGKIIGTPHAAAKFWELRQYVDPRSRSANGIHKFPEPDMIGVNSPFMRRLLETNSIPPERIIDLEGAGFTHLAASTSTGITSDSSLDKSALIFGEYDLSLTMGFLEVTAKSLGALNTQVTRVFRPHPMCLIAPKILTEYGFVTNDQSISEQLEVADLVIAPSSTSAAVEAYCLGIPVVILLSTGTFNFSPLRNMDGVFFASNETDLGLALSSASAVGRTNPKPYFNIDPTFTRWRSLLDGLQ